MVFCHSSHEVTTDGWSNRTNAAPKTAPFHCVWEFSCAAMRTTWPIPSWQQKRLLLLFTDLTWTHSIVYKKALTTPAQPFCASPFLGTSCFATNWLVNWCLFLYQKNILWNGTNSPRGRDKTQQMVITVVWVNPGLHAQTKVVGNSHRGNSWRQLSQIQLNLSQEASSHKTAQVQ